MTSQAAPKVLFFSPVIAHVLTPLEELADAAVFDSDRDDEERLRELAQGVEVIVCIGQHRIDAARLDMFPALRLVAALGVGVDGIDLEAARARGIAVTNSPGNNSPDVAELAVALWLASRRGLLGGDRIVRSGGWTSLGRPLSRAAYSDKVAIAGMGSIGQEIASRVAGLGGKDIAWWGRRPKPEIEWRFDPDLHALAEWADTLFIALPGGDETRHLVDADVLKALGPRGLVVNVGRGSVIDEAALVAALGDGSLGGAALDVYETEPYDGASMAGLDNALLSPHVGGATQEALVRLRAMTFESIRGLQSGGPIPYRLV